MKQKCLMILWMLILVGTFFSGCIKRGKGTKDEFSRISAKKYHTCALNSSGRVKCWGANGYGQLGDGTENDSKVPVEVVGLSDIIAISVGAVHSCALTSRGKLKCWGMNFSGQLGDGTNNDRKVPVEVSGLSDGIRFISAGAHHTCALISSGKGKCWGDNWAGQLGDGTENDSNVPVDVYGLSSGVSISAGSWHTCALTSSSGVKCWGLNESGQLGNGTDNNSNIPVDVYGLSSGVSAISAGWEHTCALTTSGKVKCWGDNEYGQLGDGTENSSKVPVEVSGLSSGISVISAGGYHTCALNASGQVKCWGRNGSGQIGNGTNNDSKVPVEVLGLSSGISAISAGDAHTCALNSSGKVRCWGDNSDGQLGNGTNINSNVPVDVLGFGL